MRMILVIMCGFKLIFAGTFQIPFSVMLVTYITPQPFGADLECIKINYPIIAAFPYSEYRIRCYTMKELATVCCVPTYRITVHLDFIAGIKHRTYVCNTRNRTAHLYQTISRLF